MVLSWLATSLPKYSVQNPWLFVTLYTGISSFLYFAWVFLYEFPNGTLILVILSPTNLNLLEDTFHFKTYIFDVMFLHYSDLPSHTALLYLSENALNLLYLLDRHSFIDCSRCHRSSKFYGDVYDPISVVFLTAAIVFRLHLFSNDRAVHPTLQIMLHYLFFFNIFLQMDFAFASK